MAGSNDDPLVIQFLALYAKLRDWVDNDPNGLYDLAAKDDSKRGKSVGDLAFFACVDSRRSTLCSMCCRPPPFLH